MTPFDTWYAENVERFLPADYPKNLREVGKQQSAKIWNAAISLAAQCVWPGTKSSTEQMLNPALKADEIWSLRAPATP